MLTYNVAQLLKEGAGSVRHYTLAGELYDIDERNPGPIPVEGYVNLVRTPNGVLLEGQAPMTLRLECRRCLAPYDAELAIDIEEEYVASVDVVTGVRLVPDDYDEPELLIDEHHILDTREVLWQYAVAATLDAGLCRPDCRGLCPICGANLNEEACNCHLDKVDPRLAALADLLTAKE